MKSSHCEAKNDSKISEVLTIAQHLELPTGVRRECNKTFVRCTAEAEGGQSEAFIWMRQNVGQETSRQILDDVDNSSTCKEKVVGWAKAKATSMCKTRTGGKTFTLDTFIKI